MAFEQRGIYVTSGSSVVHRFIDAPGTHSTTAEINRQSGPGKFEISGSSVLGNETNDAAKVG